MFEFRKPKYFDATLKYKGPDNPHLKKVKVLTAQIMRKKVLTAEKSGPDSENSFIRGLKGHLQKTTYEPKNLFMNL